MEFSNSNDNSEISARPSWLMRHRLFLAVVCAVIIGTGIVIQIKIQNYRKNWDIQAKPLNKSVPSQNMQLNSKDVEGLRIK